MGDGLQRASDYANPSLAPFLRDVKSGGEWEVTERYLLTALNWNITRRMALPEWAQDFARRHGLLMEHNAKQEHFKFIRARKG